MNECTYLLHSNTSKLWTYTVTEYVYFSCGYGSSDHLDYFLVNCSDDTFRVEGKDRSQAQFNKEYIIL
jgi:hypothetical protein